MRLTIAALALFIFVGGAEATEWQVTTVRAPARVMAVDVPDGQPRINAGGLWYRPTFAGGKPALTFIDAPKAPEPPENALPHGHIATGTRDIARAWFAEPTARYAHGILGDKTTAASLMIETRDGKVQAVQLKDDAVFEDLTPRLADLNGDGHDEVVVVKTSLKRGAALAIIGRREGKYDIIAETPPLGAPHRWLNPAGIADFNGDGKTDIALVRMPHADGTLELWSWDGKRLTKTGELADTANHIAGTRALGMSVVGDFDGDGHPDLAIPSFDRTHLRLVSFIPDAHAFASITLPAKAVTNIGRVETEQGAHVIVLGLEDGTLALLRRAP